MLYFHFMHKKLATTRSNRVLHQNMEKSSNFIQNFLKKPHFLKFGQIIHKKSTCLFVSRYYEPFFDEFIWGATRAKFAEKTKFRYFGEFRNPRLP